MSKYTTEVRFICETLAGYDTSQGYGKVSDIIGKSWDKVFDFDFPIFDEEYRSVLCKKILMHYYTREIGLETVGLWKLKLETLMNEIMPYYNQLYRSTLHEFDPFIDADYTKEHEGSNAGNAKTNGNDTGTRTGTITDNGGGTDNNTRWDVYSDTPQGALTNVENETYLTDARRITDNGSNTRNNTRTYNEGTGSTKTTNNDYSNTDEYLEHIKGKFPGRTYASMLKEYRESFLNIDVQVIDSLKDLFMKVW